MAEETLTPEEALRRLGELSPEVRIAALLDRSGSLAAYADTEVGIVSAGGPEAANGRPGRFARLARELFQRADRADPEPPEQLEAQIPGGAVFAVRRGGWVLAVVAERTALASLMFYDLRSVLAGLRTGEPAGDAAGGIR